MLQVTGARPPYVIVNRPNLDAFTIEERIEDGADAEDLVAVVLGGFQHGADLSALQELVRNSSINNTSSLG